MIHFSISASNITYVCQGGSIFAISVNIFQGRSQVFGKGGAQLKDRFMPQAVVGGPGGQSFPEALRF